jgi:hypothetical protein
VIESGECASTAAKAFDIPQSTLSELRGGKHPKKLGGQPVFNVAEEKLFAHNVATLGDWGVPVDHLEIRMLIRHYLNTRGMKVDKFKDNLPGEDWVRSFLKRQCGIITERLCRNISSKRSQLSSTTVRTYFDNLQVTLDGVPPNNIINFDETSLVDDPKQKKCVFRRGCKYPERVMNSTKSAISVMFSCSAAGVSLPPYVVYKAEHLHDRWIEGGEPHVRYNRSRSGWFDSVCFADWFASVIVPFCRRLPGKKVLIGDNLASHFSPEVIAKCETLNIAFVCLPPNSTHLCQPLDVSVFAPLKKYWRQVLTDWKMKEGRQFPVLPKERFPRLLSELMKHLKPTLADNIRSGFRKCGIVPLNGADVLRRIRRSPEEEAADVMEMHSSVSGAVVEILSQLHKEPETKLRKKRMNVQPGKSISLADLNTQPQSMNEDSGCNTDQMDMNSLSVESINEAPPPVSDDEEVPILPAFPVPKNRGCSPQRRPCRIRRPVVYSDFVI